MKYLLTFLLSLASLAGFAKNEYFVIFNFSQPSTLNPSIETPDVPGSSVTIDDTQYIFTAGPIKLYFKKTDEFHNIPNITVDNAANNYRRYLMLSDQNQMYVESSSNANITKIEFIADFTGNLELMNGYSGKFDLTKGWDCDGNDDVHAAAFKMVMNPVAVISKIKVTYMSDEAPAEAPAVSTSFSITSGITVPSIEHITLDFTGDGVTSVELADDTKISLTDGSAHSYSVTIKKLSGLKYDVIFNELSSGSYNLNIAEGAFVHYYQGSPANVAASTCSFTVRSTNFNYDFNDNQISNTTSFSTPITAEDFSKTKFSFAFKITRKDGSVIIDYTDPKLDESQYEEYGISKIEPIDVQVDATKICAIQTMMGRKVTTARLQREEIDSKFTGYLTIVWDEEPTSSIDDGDYDFYIPAATYGDTNFGAYLADKTSMDKANCHVNGEWLLPLCLRKNASGITDIEDSTNKNFNIRKYVENGKIIIIKGGKKYNIAGAIID